MQSTIVIDENGDLWPPGAPRLREVLMCPDPDFDVVTYAVRNLGFVLLRRQGRMVRAEMRPALVKPATLIGLYYMLVDLRPQQILLSRMMAEGASHELFDDLSEFAATVERDIDDEGMQRHRPPFTSSVRSLELLGRSRYARFAPLVDLWRDARGVLPPDLVSRLVAMGLHSRATLVRNPGGTGRLVYEYVGSGYTFIGKGCLPLLLVGRDIEMLPDSDYARAAARGYYECLREQQPRLETISAVMKRPDGQSVWSYFDRLLLPWRTDLGVGYVLGLAEVRRRAPAA